MVYLKSIVPVLCTVILAAHFLREQNVVFMLISIFSIPFLFIRRYWIVRGMQLFFVLAGMEWIHTMVVLVMEREASGLPWVRMAVILSTVAGLTLASAWVRRTPTEFESKGEPIDVQIPGPRLTE